MCRRSSLLILLAWLAAPALAYTPPKEPTLYDRMGGFNRVAAFVDDFVDRLLSDPVVAANPRVVAAFDRATVNPVPGLKAHVTNLVCQLAGGPEKYTGRSMEAAHQGLQITAEEWTAAMDALRASMDAAGFPEDVRRDLLVIVTRSRQSIVGR